MELTRWWIPGASHVEDTSGAFNAVSNILYQKRVEENVRTLRK
jgi:hypothetical protein